MQSGARSILLVDDDDNSREGLCKLLRRDGFSVESASDGYQALCRIAEKDFDVIITDLVMKGMDGRELMRNLRQRQIRSSVIVVTAYGEIETYVEMLSYDTLDFLHKPVDYDELLKILSRLPMI
jgi:DNA-binding NtrC family response regulator